MEKHFYVAIPAQTYKNLSIAVSDGETTKVMTTNKDQDIVVDRNTIYPITFVGSLTTSGISTRIDNISVKWVKLWETGPKFAEYNVGATSATDYVGLYNWGMSEIQASANLCTGKGTYASNSVFLPAAGCCNFGYAVGQGDFGLYWSSTPFDSSLAYGLC